MNCIELLTHQAAEYPDKMAIWVPGSNALSFRQLLDLSARSQNLFRAQGVVAGDHVLLIDSLGPRLYASVAGLLAMGVCVVLVEPWMPIAEIERVIRIANPKLFLANTLGRLWGLRVPAVRAIPKWAHVKEITQVTGAQSLRIEEMPVDAPGILTFTSGTTGKPKGVVRQQGYLVHQHRVLSQRLGLENHPGPDLCIFANFALANLASGRGSIVIPPRWNTRLLRSLESLGADRRPESLTCGPAFLLRLMSAGPMSSVSTSLRSIHVGGALTDCWIFEKAFSHFPQAHFSHVYGSSEAEPVAVADAHEAVRLSRARGYFQTLHLGQPVPEIRAELDANGVWVTGPHVCPRYLGNEEENRLNKRTDASGHIWHFMGDRVRGDQDGWWYAGRSSQDERIFDLEQRMYSALGSSKAFIHIENSETVACIENAKRRVEKLPRETRDLVFASMKIYDVSIHRDRRHRARIDRAASWKSRRPVALR
ncbi:MAG: AMP-binding protein [Bdellovibrionaceae bacterium]|nr:AMP-binding protein [Pseudobdellovibrionaceae bacterium]